MIGQFRIPTTLIIHLEIRCRLERRMTTCMFMAIWRMALLHLIEVTPLRRAVNWALPGPRGIPEGGMSMWKSDLTGVTRRHCMPVPFVFGAGPTFWRICPLRAQRPLVPFPPLLPA